MVQISACKTDTIFNALEKSMFSVCRNRQSGKLIANIIHEACRHTKNLKLATKFKKAVLPMRKNQKNQKNQNRKQQKYVPL